MFDDHAVKNTSSLFPFTYSLKQKTDLQKCKSDFFVLALPIFPCSHPQSIVGEGELNFCVRDGNRWTLTPINTNFPGCTLKTEHETFCNQKAVSLLSPIVGQALGLLVSVSYTPYGASTPDLSTT